MFYAMTRRQKLRI